MSAIHESLLLIAEEIGAIRKEQQNKDQHYNFRGIDAVTKAFHPLLVKHSVVLLPLLRSIDYAVIPTRSGTPMNYARVVVAFQFVHEDGSLVEVVTAGEAFDSQDKATSKAHSVALRTALLQTFTVPTDEPDPDSPVEIPPPPGQHDGTAGRFVELQEEIKAKWATIWEWDEQVVANYYTQTMGGDLYSANVEHLERFLGIVTKAADEALAQKGDK
jgi:hypothetical protein